MAMESIATKVVNGKILTDFITPSWIRCLTSSRSQSIGAMNPYGQVHSAVGYFTLSLMKVLRYLNKTLLFSRPCSTQQVTGWPDYCLTPKIICGSPTLVRCNP